ncbi:F-box protein At5g18160-like [Bidens hawaiensis]|uniref:F-box protein At5g18160-like n=1 Tax=Bidens hawaiensis TaxID=980011 RepID=UPI00404B1248
MSGYITTEIQAEIMKLLPVKSLIRFQSVSKKWKSLIDGSEFITSHSISSGDKPLLLSCEHLVDTWKETYVLIPDATFPHHIIPLTVPVLVNRLQGPRLLSSSHGLFCFYGINTGSCNTVAVVCNLSIRKAVGVVVPFKRADGMQYRNHVGFGVCPQTIDPKIVNFVKISRPSYETISWQVQVFSLNTRTWRRPLSSNPPPRSTIRFYSIHVYVNGFLYWLADDIITTVTNGMPKYSKPKPVIVSLDMASEEFGEITLPRSLANRSIRNLCIYKSRESLVVIENNEEAGNRVFNIWMLKDGIPKSFTKLYTVNVSSPKAVVMGFRGEGRTYN